MLSGSLQVGWAIDVKVVHFHPIIVVDAVLPPDFDHR